MGSPGSGVCPQTATRDHQAGGDNIAERPNGPIIRIVIRDLVITIRNWSRCGAWSTLRIRLLLRGDVKPAAWDTIDLHPYKISLKTAWSSLWPGKNILNPPLCHQCRIHRQQRTGIVVHGRTRHRSRHPPGRIECTGTFLHWGCRR